MSNGVMDFDLPSYFNSINFFLGFRLFRFVQLDASDQVVSNKVSIVLEEVDDDNEFLSLSLVRIP